LFNEPTLRTTAACSECHYKHLIQYLYSSIGFSKTVSKTWEFVLYPLGMQCAHRSRSVFLGGIV